MGAMQNVTTESVSHHKTAQNPLLSVLLRAMLQTHGYRSAFHWLPITVHLRCNMIRSQVTVAVLWSQAWNEKCEFKSTFLSVQNSCFRRTVGQRRSIKSTFKSAKTRLLVKFEMTRIRQLITYLVSEDRLRSRDFCNLPSISLTRASISWMKCSGSTFSASSSFSLSLSIVRSSLMIWKALTASLGSSWSPNSRPMREPLSGRSARINPERADSMRRRHMVYVYSRGWNSDCPARVIHGHLRFIYHLTPPPARPPAHPSQAGQAAILSCSRHGIVSVSLVQQHSTGRLCIVSEASLQKTDED